MKPIKGLALTPDEAAGVAKYREWVQSKREAGHLRRFYDDIDQQFPELDPETRDELADKMYRKALSEKALQRVARK